MNAPVTWFEESRAPSAPLYGAGVLGVLLLSSLAAFLLSSRLRAMIATPMSPLVQATASVSQTRDYSIRARKLSRDELGVLVDAFNEMLAGIEFRDSELRDYRKRRLILSCFRGRPLEMNGIGLAARHHRDGLDLHGVAVAGNGETPLHNLVPRRLQLDELRPVEPQRHF
jgi:HAMP domain-containing protein